MFSVTSETPEEAREDGGVYHVTARERPLAAQARAGRLVPKFTNRKHSSKNYASTINSIYHV